MRYLLDTDICIYLLNGGSESLRKRFMACRATDLGVSAITEAELLYGALHSARPAPNRDRVRVFIAPLEVCPFDFSAARHFAELKQVVTNKGKPIGLMDLLIAAVARSRGLTVVTNNTKHFAPLPGVSVENWAR